MKPRRWLGLLLAAAALPAVADPAPAAVAAAALPQLVPTEVVDAWQEALAAGDRSGVVGHLAPDLVIYEQGFVEQGRDRYAEGSMPNDITFASMVRRRVLSREAWEDGNVAWVLTRTAVTGDFGEQQLALVNTETLLLRRTDLGWKIVHIHRSAHPLAEDEVLPEPLPGAPARAPAPAAPAAAVTPAPAPAPEPAATPAAAPPEEAAPPETIDTPGK